MAQLSIKLARVEYAIIDLELLDDEIVSVVISDYATSIQIEPESFMRRFPDVEFVRGGTANTMDSMFGKTVVEGTQFCTCVGVNKWTALKSTAKSDGIVAAQPT